MDSTEETSERGEVHLTAWHVFLVELLQHFTDLQKVDVRDFVKLGTLPLEADVIFLIKTAAAAPGLQHLMQPELDFLEARLRRLTVVEYKSPKDVLTQESVDTSRAYGLLAKRKFEVKADREVAVVLLYSYAEKGLFETLREDGLDFQEEEAGIRCYRGTIVMYAINLVVLGARRPGNPLNLMSARHREYSHAPGIDAGTLALLERIRYLISQGKARGMALDKLQGIEEISQDMAAIRRRFLQSLDPKERLEGLGIKERLEGLGAKERLEGLGIKERLEGLGAKERLEGLGAKERLEGLDASAEEELFALLLAKRQQRHHP